jgi:hypothetical protein
MRTRPQAVYGEACHRLHYAVVAECVLSGEQKRVAARGEGDAPICQGCYRQLPELLADR